ncbi:glycine oxidase ThiO [Corynebacterium sp. CCM 8862]|uniref:glycine oxidase n=1 Tax=Corynebacterium mendelii TaxID=2765362 RepID=A0A939DZ11_9CORY|nr:glycine oxidase ThiO [Corynebacterium mendelii]
MPPEERTSVVTPAACCVIGAGLVGLATAFELASRGHPVTVIDPEPMSGASHHAAGMLAPAAEIQYGQDNLVPLMRASMALYPDLVQRVAAASGCPTGYLTCGTIVVAADGADRRHLRELADFQHAAGMDVEVVTTRYLRQLEPAIAPVVAGAALIPGDHQIDPRVFGAALMCALKKLGVRFEERKATPDDLGPKTVMAAGLGAAEYFPFLPLRPVWGEIMRLDVPDAMTPLVTHVIRGFVEDRPVYVVPRGNGSVVLGATSRENHRKWGSLGGVYQLLRDGIRLVPGLEECSISDIGTGGRPGTPDDLPLVGTDTATGTVISTGYFRHGILLTALAARLGAALVTGDRHVTGLDDRAVESILTHTDPYRWSN